jgi:hypothetical protein
MGRREWEKYEGMREMGGEFADEEDEENSQIFEAQKIMGTVDVALCVNKIHRQSC